MRTVKIISLGLLLVIQVFYVCSIRLRHKTVSVLTGSSELTKPPPEYAIITDGESWSWTRPLGVGTQRFRAWQDFTTKEAALASAWYQYRFELKTNIWTNVWFSGEVTNAL